MARAREDLNRPDNFRADLPAESLYICVLERVTGVTRGSLRAACRTAHVDDTIAHRFCAGGMDFFTIHGIARVDGDAASLVLVRRYYFRAAIFESRIFLFARAIERGLLRLGHYFSARDPANDHRTAPDHWHRGNNSAVG